MLSPGVSKDFAVRRSVSPTGLPMNYRLTRNQDGSFDVILNISFYESSSSPEKKYDPILTKKWRDISEKCLQSIDGHAWGPDGIPIKFKIYNSDYDSVPFGTAIEMRDSGRAHSLGWTRDLECPVILHELLHLTGLVDEYAESSMGYVHDKKTGKWNFVENEAEKSAFNCRKEFEKNSIMSNEDAKWNEVMGNWNLRLDDCECKETDVCEKYFKTKSKDYNALLTNGGMLKERQKLTYPNECPRGFEKSGKGSIFLCLTNQKSTSILVKWGASVALNFYRFSLRPSLFKKGIFWSPDTTMLFYFLVV